MRDKLAPAHAPRVCGLVLLTLALLAVVAGPAEAQPFGFWSIFSDAQGGYIEVPHDPALSPGSAITIEGWISVSAGSGCRSIIGKGWTEAWWIGVCGDTLRSYIRGTASQANGGVIPNNRWTHFAVTSDGTTRKHYINGEETGSFAEGGPPTPSTAPVRLASDVSWNIIPDAALNEMRLWSTARTVEQIRANINVPLSSPQAGLIAVWSNGGGGEALGNHPGVIVGDVFGLTFPVAPDCIPMPGSTFHCFENRFVVSVDWRALGTDGPGTIVPGFSDNSGLFWFFEPDNWEVLVKVLNGCGLNNRYWVFYAATTNVFFRMEVFDVVAGVNKVYFNYPGPPAQTITDTAAFATCP